MLAWSLLSVLSLSCTRRSVDGALVDQVGAPVGPTAAKRIITLAPDVTEMVFALGAGDRVVAVSTAADYPPSVRALPHVDPFDPEAVVALQPDLVVATTAGDDPRIIARLRALGIPVLVTDVTSCDRLVSAVRLVASGLHRQAAGDRLATELERQIRDATARAAALPERRAIFVVWWNPLIIAGQDTFHDDLLRRAHLVNLAPGGAGRYPRVSPETLLGPDLEIVVAPDEPAVRDGFATVIRSPAGSRLAAGAVRVLWIPADLTNRPGPRLPLALDALVAAREHAP